MIIDARIRPPYKSYLQTSIPYNLEFTGNVARNCGLEAPISAHKANLGLMFEEMEQTGVTHGVICGRMSDNWGDVPNEEIAEVVKMHPKKFKGIGAVHPKPTNKVLDEIKKCVDLGLVGINVDPGQLNPPQTPAGAILYPIYAACQEYGLIAYVTTNICSAPNGIWSNPAYVDQVAVDFPELKILIGHACHPHVAEICGIAFWRKNVFLTPGLYFNYVTNSEIYIKNANGPLQDQILFSSSYPVASFESCVKAHQAAGLSPECYDKVMWKNASKLFGFDI